MFDVLLNTEGSDATEYDGERFHVDECIPGFDIEANDVTHSVEILAARLSDRDKCRSNSYLLAFFAAIGVEMFCSSRVSTQSSL